MEEKSVSVDTILSSSATVRMRITVIYAETLSSTVAALFGGCAELAVEFIEYNQFEARIREGWQADAFFCQLREDQTLSPLLAEIARCCPRALLFSYSDTSLNMGAHSSALGFIAHLDEATTPAELLLHLRYGQRLALERDFDIMQALSAVTTLHFSLDNPKVIESALEYLPAILGADSLALFLSTKEGDKLELVGQVNAPESEALAMEDEPQSSLLVQAAVSGRSINISGRAVLTDTRYRDSGFQAVMCLPLYTRARMFGVLEVATRRPDKVFRAQDLEFAEKFAASLAVALANASSFANAERLCQIDDLTQLYNARYLYQALESELKRSRRYKFPVSVIFLDLDGFKLVNDTNGHLCGSATLTEVANLMMGLVRETDIVARYGGDEFVIVLPETPAERAVTIAERIRKQIEAHIFKGGGDSEIYLTASFGVASYPEHASSPAALIRCADKAMYTAKEYNKNQVVLAN